MPWKTHIKLDFLRLELDIFSSSLSVFSLSVSAFWCKIHTTAEGFFLLELRSHTCVLIDRIIKLLQKKDKLETIFYFLFHKIKVDLIYSITYTLTDSQIDLSRSISA